MSGVLAARVSHRQSWQPSEKLLSRQVLHTEIILTRKKLAPEGVLVSFVSGVYFAHLKGQLKLKATVFKAVVSVVRVGDCHKNFVIK